MTFDNLSLDDWKEALDKPETAKLLIEELRDRCREYQWDREPEGLCQLSRCKSSGLV